MTQTKTRKERGFVNDDSWKYASIAKYNQAADAKDLWSENVAYQEALHKNLGKEIAAEAFQRDNRNNVRSRCSTEMGDIIATSDTDLIERTIQSELSDERRMGKPRFSNVSKLIVPTPDEVVAVRMMLEEIVLDLTDPEKWIFAWILNTCRVDEELEGCKGELRRFCIDFITKLHDKGIVYRNQLYKHLQELYDLRPIKSRKIWKELNLKIGNHIV